MSQVMMTTSNVIEPPNITAGAAPMIREVKPLSNMPSSLEELMNMEFTEDTRPRISSGVVSCRIVPRTSTLIPSSIPAVSRATKETQ